MVESSSPKRAVPIPIGMDYLSFKMDSGIMNLLSPNGKIPPYNTFLVSEQIVFSTKVLKYNRFGMRQERNLLLTTHYLCNVKKREF
jgi:hypothetical protein